MLIPCPYKISCTNFRTVHSTIRYCLLSHYSGVLEKQFPCGVSQFCDNLGLNCLFHTSKFGAHFAVGSQDIFTGWAILVKMIASYMTFIHGSG